MAAFYYDEIHGKPGMMHDHMESYTVKFWFTNDEGYRSRGAIWMYIEDYTSDNKILNKLKKQYKDPEIISVKRH